MMQNLRLYDQTEIILSITGPKRPSGRRGANSVKLLAFSTDDWVNVRWVFEVDMEPAKTGLVRQPFLELVVTGSLQHGCLFKSHIEQFLVESLPLQAHLFSASNWPILSCRPSITVCSTSTLSPWPPRSCSSCCSRRRLFSCCSLSSFSLHKINWISSTFSGDWLDKLLDFRGNHIKGVDTVCRRRAIRSHRSMIQLSVLQFFIHVLQFISFAYQPLNWKTIFSYEKILTQ